MNLNLNLMLLGDGHLHPPEYSEFDDINWEGVGVGSQGVGNTISEASGHGRGAGSATSTSSDSGGAGPGPGPGPYPSILESRISAGRTTSQLALERPTKERDSYYDNIARLHRSQVPPETGHLGRYVMDGFVGRKDHLEIPRIVFHRSRTLGVDGHLALEQKTPILLEIGMTPQPGPAKLSTSSETSVCSDFETLLSEKQRERLVQLFFRFVQPGFPILPHLVPGEGGGDSEADSESDSDTLKMLRDANAPLALRASLYATALPFAMHDDHLSATLTDMLETRERLYSIATTAILEEANSPSIENLQACLLLLQKGPTSQHQLPGLTPTFSWLTSLAVTMARWLGLQYDCSSWSIPLTEKQLRTRLWWATFCMDLWMSMDSPGGRSIGSQDYDIPVLRPAPEFTDDVGFVPSEAIHFYHLVTLTCLLSQIYESYYTVRASKETASNMLKSLEHARPIRSALNECRQRLNSDLPLDEEGSGLSASVHLACSVVSIILFRALLRPIQNHVSTLSTPTAPHRSAADAILTGSVNCARSAVELLESMVSVVGPWNSFWHSWSQGNFAMVSTFLVQLLLLSVAEVSQEGMRSEVSQLISRWKRAIRIGAGGGGWASSLMSMALSRLDSLLNQITDNSLKA
ncbi:hypothetical protein A1O3_08930 [Capronia epimyces CBS 606.96]|uniref:Xylanolytic transcriptional activator regulatory domain-containing protein n=1 Tax=Capronia epimyces CBS 606.96 TaxID=1182542 RepID=W9XGT7_9EURO|nr:uncharacterized protein A1O3_08930 [Capronia epimyces CBS 606.96]EXJ79428.1 hypothetical protein A1O3_08930 [Capronia epimyces CBS 606.96]